MVVANNNQVLWSLPLYFAQSCLQIPHRGKKRVSLASSVNDKIRYEITYPLPPPPSVKPTCRCKHQVLKVMNHLDGDFKNAIRLVCSEVTANHSHETLDALKIKHPKHENTITPMTELV